MSAENLREQISNWAEDEDSEILLADGFEEAFLGIGAQYPNMPVAVYDRDKCLEILMRDNDMSYEDAVEYFEFNVSGAYVGEKTPIFIIPFKA